MPKSAGVKRDIDAIEGNLDHCLDLLESGPEALHSSHQAVSRWSPAQHLDHIGLVLAANVKAVRAIRSGDRERLVEGPRPGFLPRVVLLTGRIPRGRASAPETVVPVEAPQLSGIAALLEKLKEQVRELREDIEVIVALAGRIAHPVLGAFSAAQWVRFAHIHVEHHLSIIRDIEKARA